MTRPLTAGVTVMAALLAVSPAFAQRTTGTIFGTVTDESGGVLPGVTVTLTSTAVPGAPTTITTEAGTYRFVSLPPGSYDLTFELAGFATINRASTSVPLGSSVQIDEIMKVSGLSEAVTVTGETPIIDATTNQISTNYNREWVENAPVRRNTFFDLINAAPGVSAVTSTSASSTSFGSGTTDNSYQLDGTDFTAPSTGQAWPWPNTDAIEEVQVLSLGATAEYGNLMGAVFNVVTRQGSNEFHGDANYYFQSDGLTSRNTTDEQDEGKPVLSRPVSRCHGPARRSDPSRQAVVLRVVSVSARLGGAGRQRSRVPGTLRSQTSLLQAELSAQ